VNDPGFDDRYLIAAFRDDNAIKMILPTARIPAPVSSWLKMPVPFPPQAFDKALKLDKFWQNSFFRVFLTKKVLRVFPGFIIPLPRASNGAPNTDPA